MRPIALLIGCGKMGGALLSGWLARDSLSQIVVVDPAAVQDAFPPNVIVVAHRDAVPKGFAPDILIFAVKPQLMDMTAPAYAALAASGGAILSIAAGKSIAAFERYFGQDAEIVRAMPNLPASVGRGITVAVGNRHLSTSARELCTMLLGAVGDVEWTTDESLLDAVTAVSGSGPAYVFLVIEAMTAAGIKAGLPAELASKLARATVSGAGELARVSPESAAELRRDVTSPKGTTAAALEVLMALDGIQQLFDRAIAAAADRSRELAS